MKIFYGIEPNFTENDSKQFSRGNYECVLLLKTRKGMPVAVSKSKDPDSPIWKVENGFSCVVFASYEEALAYCRGRFTGLEGKEV